MLRSTAHCAVLQSQGDAQTSKSGLRRRAIRQTWLPAVAKYPNLRAHFVVGRPIKPSAIALFRKELDLKQDFLFLDFQVCYTRRALASAGAAHAVPATAHAGGRAPGAQALRSLLASQRCLQLQGQGRSFLPTSLCSPAPPLQECDESDCSSRKLLAFFEKVTALYDAAWIAKIDDAVYLSPQRLQLAARQWEAMHVEYIGCMKRAINIPSASQWQQRLQFDKDRMLLGYDDVLSAHAAAFAVAGAVVEEGLLPNRQHLRLFASAGAPQRGVVRRRLMLQEYVVLCACYAPFV